MIDGKYENAKVLIDAGADVDYLIRTETANFTALNWAIIQGDIKAFNLLISSHADPNCVRVSHQDGTKNPALFDAVWKKQHEMVKRLVFAGADINCCQEKSNGETFTLLEQARANYDTDIIPFLISHGAIER